VIRSEITPQLDVEQLGQYVVIANVSMTIEWQVGGVERDVGLDQTGNATVGGADEWPQTAPKDAVMDQQAVGALLGRVPHRGLAEVDGRGKPRDLARVADLEAIQRLGSVSTFLGNVEILIEKTDESV